MKRGTRWTLASILVIGLPTSAAGNIETLVERNPFGKDPAPPPPPPPRPTQTAPAPQLAAQYEWIGFFESSGPPRFGFRDRATNRSFWVAGESTENGLTVVGFDIAKREVQIRQGTTYGVLGFKEANYAGGAPPPQRVPNPPPVNTVAPTPPGIEQAQTTESKPNVVRRRIIVPRRTTPSAE